MSVCEIDPKALDEMAVADYLRLQAAYAGFSVGPADLRGGRVLIAYVLHQPLSEIDALEIRDFRELAEDKSDGTPEARFTQ